jgi:hypothetical protein
VTVARWARGFLRFWVDFLVGDDWVVAAGVGVALLATWGLSAADVSAWWLLPPAVVAAIAVSLWRAVRRERA